MQCPYCDHVIYDDTIICPSCESIIGEHSEQEIYAARKRIQRKKSRKKMLLGGGFALIAAALAVFVAVVIVPSIKNRPTNPRDDAENSYSFDVQRPLAFSYAMDAFEANAGTPNAAGVRTFDPGRAIDQDGVTCWMVDKEDANHNKAYITFVLEKAADIAGFGMINGNQYQPEENLYSKNGQIRDFTLILDGEEYSFSAERNEGDQDRVQYFELPDVIYTDTITLRVDSVHEGQKYPNNVSLGEFMAFPEK